MDKNTQQKVDNGPWRHGITRDMKPCVFVESDDFLHDVRLYVDGDFSDTAERIAYAKGIASQLNAAPPVPRDVLMAVAEAAFLNGHQNANGYEPRDIFAIVDTYASQLQAEPVNQQMLADALEQIAEWTDDERAKLVAKSALLNTESESDCASCNGFDSGCEECSGLGKAGHLAALRNLAKVAHRVAHVMGMPAGFDVTKLPEVVAERLAAIAAAEKEQGHE